VKYSWAGLKQQIINQSINLAQWFWRRRFLNHPTHFCNYLPFEENLALYLNNLKSPLPWNDLHQVLLKLAYWFWRRFWNIFNVFLLFCYYLPLGKGIPLHLNNLQSPPPEDNFCQVLSKLAQWFWRRSRKCKSFQTERWTIAHLSFQLRWAKEEQKYVWLRGGDLSSFRDIQQFPIPVGWDWPQVPYPKYCR
jgi:hypothetical protein